MKRHKKRSKSGREHAAPPPRESPGTRLGRRRIVWGGTIAFGLVLIAVTMKILSGPTTELHREVTSVSESPHRFIPEEKWLVRSYEIDSLFHVVYTPCWEGAYGAIGDAHLFAVTGDSSLLRFHSSEHDLRSMCSGNWVDDRAWVCLAEMYWWRFTGRTNVQWVADAMRRYMEARDQGRLCSHDGYWSWFNWPPNAGIQQVFSNSNMNQMVSVACWLYEVTGEKQFLDDALLVWNGDRKFPGIEKMFYKGGGRWVGSGGLAAFGNPLPWEGAGYCSIGAALYRVTHESKYKTIAVETAKYIMNPRNGWVDPVDYYQLRMDGNGAFVHFLLDAYQIAPGDLRDLPGKIEKMLDHVWTNAHGHATVALHREFDNGVRNGWNPHGGEDGYKVDEVGTVHAQGEAVRAFGVFSYVLYSDRK